MSKKFKASLQNLNADQVTEKLGELCEKSLQILTDKNIGVTKTLFKLIALMATEHVIDLTVVAAQKNGVAGVGGTDGTMVAVADAVEKRGSHSAEKVRTYVNAIEKYRKAGAGFSRFQCRRNVMVAKLLGPNP